MKNIKREDLLLYAITNRSWLGEESLLEQVKKALEGGITLLQLREKKQEKEQIVRTAKEILKVCREYHVPLIINDSVEIAMECDADGVHLGQSDMGILKARKILGDGKIIGASARTVEQAVRAEREGADYLGVGAVFPTSTKEDAKAVSNETIFSIRQSVSIPIVAIGGISEENVGSLKGSGIDGIAVISAIFSKKDITESAKRLKELVMKVVE